MWGYNILTLISREFKFKAIMLLLFVVITIASVFGLVKLFQWEDAPRIECQKKCDPYIAMSIGDNCFCRNVDKVWVEKR